MTGRDQSNDRADGGGGARDGDARFTHGLIHDVFGVLEAHGYRRPSGPHRGRDYNRATADAVVALLTLVAAFEGTAPRDREGGAR